MSTTAENFEIKIVNHIDDIDITTINHLLFELTGRKYAITTDDLQKMLDDSNSQLFIAAVDGKIVGMASLGTYLAPTGRKAWIEDVVVLPQMQGQGIGRKLIEHIIDFVNHHMAPCSLMLTSHPSRIAANGLYRNVGFEQRITNVYKMAIEE